MRDLFILTNITFKTVKEVAIILNKSERTIYRYIKKNKINYYQIGGIYRFDIKDVLNFRRTGSN